MFQRVMQRIIQRYIFDIQREAEVTEGNSMYILNIWHSDPNV